MVGYFAKGLIFCLLFNVVVGAPQPSFFNKVKSGVSKAAKAVKSEVSDVASAVKAEVSEVTSAVKDSDLTKSASATAKSAFNTTKTAIINKLHSHDDKDSGDVILDPNNDPSLNIQTNAAPENLPVNDHSSGVSAATETAETDESEPSQSINESVEPTPNVSQSTNAETEPNTDGAQATTEATESKDNNAATEPSAEKTATTNEQPEVTTQTAQKPAESEKETVETSEQLFLLFPMMVSQQVTENQIKKYNLENLPYPLSLVTLRQ